jgi:hypothetical protein
MASAKSAGPLCKLSKGLGLAQVPKSNAPHISTKNVCPLLISRKMTPDPPRHPVRRSLVRRWKRSREGGTFRATAGLVPLALQVLTFSLSTISPAFSLWRCGLAHGLAAGQQDGPEFGRCGLRIPLLARPSTVKASAVFGGPSFEWRAEGVLVFVSCSEDQKNEWMSLGSAEIRKE